MIYVYIRVRDERVAVWLLADQLPAGMRDNLCARMDRLFSRAVFFEAFFIYSIIVFRSLYQTPCELFQ